MTLSTLTYSNNFGDWFMTTNSLIQQSNLLSGSDYVKSNGTFYITSPSALQANGSVVLSGNTSITKLLANLKSTIVDNDEFIGRDSTNNYSTIRFNSNTVYNYLKPRFDSLYSVANSIYTPNFSGAVARNELSKLGERISVKDFGAVGDGVTDDTNALALAIAYCGANSKALYIPSGTYKINDTTGVLTQSISTNLSLIGDGHTSILKFIGKYGIKLTPTTGNETLIIKDIWFQAGRPGTDVGISWNRNYSFFATGQSGHRYFIIDNVMFAPSASDRTSYYFVNPIYILNCPHSYINNIFIYGKANNTTLMLYGIYLDNQCTDSHILSSHVYFAETAIYVGSSQIYPDHTEGVIVSDCILVYNNKGINIDQNFPQPGHRITNSHINTFTYGIRICNAIQVYLSGLLMYKQPTSTNDFHDIIFNAVNNSQIIGINFAGGNPTTDNNSLNTAITLDDYACYNIGLQYVQGNDLAQIITASGLGNVIAFPYNTTNYYTLSGVPIYVSPSTTPIGSNNINPAFTTNKNSTSCTISNCNIAQRNRGVYLGNSLGVGSTANRVIDIKAQQPKSNYVEIVEGTGLNNTNYVKCFSTYRYEQLKLNANTSITSNVPTAIQWNISDSGALNNNQNFVYFPEVFSSFDTPTRLTINTKHTNKVSLRAGIGWGINTNGVRSLQIVRNGSEIIAATTSQGISSLNVYQTVDSGVISVDIGDYFEVYVQQTSGNNINVNVGTYTFFQITPAHIY